MSDVRPEQLAAVVVITYGHDSAMAREALQPVLELGSESVGLLPVIVDDHSGKAPSIDGVLTLVTPNNVGYAGAVNYAVTQLANVKRIVFINPDATLSPDDLTRLARPDDPYPVYAPAIREGSDIQNIRSILGCWSVLAMLMAQRLGQQSAMPACQFSDGALAPEWAIAGTVVSFDRDFLASHPLRPEMFWVEMSAFAQDYPHIRPRVFASGVQHSGDSTRSTAATKVVASRLAAEVAYVREYGSWVQRLLIVPCFVAGRLVQLATRRIRIRTAWHLWQMYAGRRDWKDVA